MLEVSFDRVYLGFFQCRCVCIDAGMDSSFC